MTMTNGTMVRNDSPRTELSFAGARSEASRDPDDDMTRASFLLRLAIFDMLPVRVSVPVGPTLIVRKGS